MGNKKKSKTRAIYEELLKKARAGELTETDIKSNSNVLDSTRLENLHRAMAEAEHLVRMAAALDSIPVTTFRASFPTARGIHRHFVLHIGPTNSGKTHDAIEALEKAESGCYLAPLRLLALEIGDRMRTDGIDCSIVTGEERDVVDGAMHISSTIEMMRQDEIVDVAVIDEAQMMDDVQRGGAWSAALVGVPARTVHVCAAVRAEKMLTRIIDLCGDDYEIVRHERDTELIVEDSIYDNRPLDGDALVCFSRKNVLGTATALEKRGIKASVVYGALPWQARKEEARKFRDGETKVIVSTDAIGMGLNLPIKRVVFLEDKKYDGTEVRRLNREEYKQIAGRAGRRGMYEVGYTTTATEDGNECLRDALNMDSNSCEVAYISFPRWIGMNEDHLLSDLIVAWGSKALDDDEKLVFEKCRYSNILSAARWLDANLPEAGCPDVYVTPDRKSRIALSFIPFDFDRDEQQWEWVNLVAKWFEKSRFENDSPHPMLPGGSEWRLLPRGRKLKNETLENLEGILTSLGIRFAFATAVGALDDEMNGKFAEYRGKVFDEVIRKLNGPKQLIGSYFTNYKRIGDEWDRRHNRRWDFYDESDEEDWNDSYDGFFMNKYNEYW